VKNSEACKYAVLSKKVTDRSVLKGSLSKTGLVYSGKMSCTKDISWSDCAFSLWMLSSS
jgi:hypothetical protein